MQLDELGLKALAFATEKHEGQKRKYTNEDYIVHPTEVAKLIHDHSVFTEYLNMAIPVAFMHDLLEDTDTTEDDIKTHFGGAIELHVRQLSDVSKPSDGNRAVRKKIDRDHVLGLTGGSVIAVEIKVADLVSNSRSIIEHDPKFAKVYIAEIELFIEELVKKIKKLGYTTPHWDRLTGSPLLSMLQEIVTNYRKNNPCVR